MDSEVLYLVSTKQEKPIDSIISIWGVGRKQNEYSFTDWGYSIYDVMAKVIKTAFVMEKNNETVHFDVVGRLTMDYMGTVAFLIDYSGKAPTIKLFQFELDEDDWDDEFDEDGILYMYNEDGMSPEEIAEEMEISLETVKAVIDNTEDTSEDEHYDEDDALESAIINVDYDPKGYGLIRQKLENEKEYGFKEMVESEKDYLLGGYLGEPYEEWYKSIIDEICED